MQRYKNKCKRMLYIGVIAIIGFSMFSVFGIYMSNVEHPKYEVISSSAHYEIRDYKPMILAEVTVNGSRKHALEQGFHLLSDYIFGNNHSKEKIHMTAPVSQQTDVKNVLHHAKNYIDEHEVWKVMFVMPAKYNLHDLPKPNNKEIKLVQLPEQKYVVIKFSGRNTNDNIKHHLEQLEHHITNEKLHTKKYPVIAFYNPPWTLPFLRRNEIMIEIK